MATASGEGAPKEHLEPMVRHVPACKPYHLRRCAAPLDKVDEVVVFGQYGSLGLASLLEDLRVFGVSETEITNVNRFHAELPPNPRIQPW